MYKKKHKFILYFLFFIFQIGIKCNGFTQVVDSIAMDNNMDTLSIEDFINYESIPVVSNKQNLYSKFGKPSSVKSYKIKNDKNSYSNIKYYSFSNSYVTYSFSNSKMVLCSLFLFDTTAYIRHKKIILSNNTKISIIKDLFVKSYRLKYNYPIEFIINENHTKWQSLSRFPLICVPFIFDGNHIMRLFFSNENLIYIDVSEI